MANKAVLYIDLLGVQNIWKAGGAEAVHDRIEEFNAFIQEQLNYLPSAIHREGEYTVILTADSVSIMCQEYDQAIGIGTHLFTQAFYATDKVSSPFWLRGAIACWKNQYFPFNTVPISSKGLQIGTRYMLEHDFLSVLALEKSGFRGMRLIIDKRLLPCNGQSFNVEWLDFKQPLITVTRLNECNYPKGEGYADVLWMAQGEKQYSNLKNIMASRFKKSTADPDEFVQAAWTRATFDQVDTLVWACRNTTYRKTRPESLSRKTGAPQYGR